MMHDIFIQYLFTKEVLLRIDKSNVSTQNVFFKYALCIVSNRFIFQFLGNVCKHYPHIAFKFEEEKSNYFGTYYNGRSYLEESCFELNHHQNCIAVCVLVTDTF